MKNYTKLYWTKVLCSIILTFLIIPIYTSQTNSDQTASYYKDQLELKGIQIELSSAQKLSIYDFQKIVDFDFNEYRNEKSEKGVQLQNGPLLHLRSLIWMRDHSFVINEDLLQRKSGEVIDPNLQPSIVLLELGIGLIPASSGERWSTPNN